MDQLAKEKEFIKSRYKAKKKGLKESIERKTKELEKLAKELASKNFAANVNEYEDKIKALTAKLEEVNIRAKKFIEGMQHAHQREQRLISSVIFELGNLLTQALNKNKGMGLSHQSLVKLIESTNKSLNSASNHC